MELIFEPDEAVDVQLLNGDHVASHTHLINVGEVEIWLFRTEAQIEIHAEHQSLTVKNHVSIRLNGYLLSIHAQQLEIRTLKHASEDALDRLKQMNRISVY